MKSAAPELPRHRELEPLFHRLANEWRAGRSHSSTVADMAMEMPYQQIIGLGDDAVPFLLAELERQPDHWFWALHAITRADPVPQEHRGNVARMAQAWIDWGRQQGYTW